MEQSCCIGVMAYNEEANIGNLLHALVRQQISCCHLQEIVVVASGCTDRTIPVVQEYATRHPHVTLLVQEQREGKASAINLFLQHVQAADIVVLESADTLPADEYTVDRLLGPLVQMPEVGMTGVRPIPIDSSDDFLGFVVNLQWSLHHRISLKSPKLGEMVAFKNILPAIPNDTAVDEACIEALITPQGYSLGYVPEAVVYNKGPDTVHDFLKQRRRIAAGHHHLQQTQKYQVSTLSPLLIVTSLLESIVWTPRQIFWTCGAIGLEIYGRWLGCIDFYLKHQNPFTWDIAITTKHLNTGE
jgi:cellulose synthase/poly-beta-1,6-N-acetylglucosamine synthase-like glycosyltransferase